MSAETRQGVRCRVGFLCHSCVVVLLFWLSLYDPGVEWVVIIVRSEWLTLLYVSFLFFYKAKVRNLRTLKKKSSFHSPNHLISS